MKRNDTRPLTINNQEWEYKIGKNTVAIYSPEGERHFPKFTDIVGEEAVLKKHFRLNPAEILNFILISILKEKPQHFRCSCCHSIKSDVTLRVDPFAVEIHENYTKHFMCNTCEANLAGDI